MVSAVPVKEEPGMGRKRLATHGYRQRYFRAEDWPSVDSVNEKHFNGPMKTNSP